MKNAKIRKVLFTFIIVGILSLVLSIKGYAATKMLDELVVMNNSNVTRVLGTDAGIYQTALNAYMETSRTMDTSIANTRTQYGAGETLKIRFSFSKEIESSAGLRLGIRFGDGAERVIESGSVDGSYLTFSYAIQSGDSGGLIITFIEGTVTDSSGKSIPLGILGKENTWTNTIIAKGSWNDDTYTVGEPYHIIQMPENEPAYILDNGKIRPMQISDVKILKTDEKGITTIQNATDGLVFSGTGVTQINITPGNEIYIPNACDIAGNMRTITNVKTEKWYILSCNGNFRDADKQYYCNAGKIIEFLRINGSNATITIGGSSRTLTAGDVVANNVQKFSYIIAAGDNGVVTTADGVAKNIIADTTPPTTTFTGIYMTEGTAYYSETGLASNNTNGSMLGTGEENKKTSGTIWAKKDARFYLTYNLKDNYGIESGWVTSDGNKAFLDGAERHPYNAMDIKANSEGLCDWSKYCKDYAGNVSSYAAVGDSVTLICDTKNPEIDITTTGESTSSDKITFTIAPRDPNTIDNYLGSGITHDNNQYRPIKIEDVMIANGTYIGSNATGNTLTVDVMPNGDGYISVYVPARATQDNVGNQSNASAITKVYSDRTKPIINDVTGNPTDWTDKARLSVIASDAGVGIADTNAYSFDGGTSWQTNNFKDFTSNQEVQIQVKDKLGNLSEIKTVSISKIDTNNPTISGVDYHQGWTNQDVEVTINASDTESGIAAYSFDGGTSWQESPKKTYTSSSTIAANMIKVKDYVGKEVSYNQAVNIQIDKNAPRIDNVTITPSTETNGTVQLVVTASDNGESGIAGYSFEGKAYSNSNTYTVSKNGDITIRVKDNAGNETNMVKTVNNIITVKPTIKITNNGGNFVMPTEGNAKLKTVIEVESQTDCTIYYGISTSNINAPQYQSRKSNRVEVELEVPQAGNYYIWSYAVNANNVQSDIVKSNAFVVRNSVIGLTPSTTNLTNQDVKVDIAYGEGLTEHQYAGIGDNREAGLTSVTLSENGTVYAEATDIAGNKVYRTLNINNIDKVAPAITIGVQTQEYILGLTDEIINMNNNISIQEEHLNKVEYTWVTEDKEPTNWDNNFTSEQILAKSANVTKEVTKKDVGVWYLYVKATDEAGNSKVTKTGRLVVKLAIMFDTTTEGTCIKEIKTINETNYVVVPEGTKVENLLKYIISPYEVTIKASNSDKEISKTSKLATNQNMTVDNINTQYRIVVRGDVTGDGEVDLGDILRLNEYRLNGKELTTAEFIAGNIIDTDDEINMSDILGLNEYRLNR